MDNFFETTMGCYNCWAFFFIIRSTEIVSILPFFSKTILLLQSIFQKEHLDSLYESLSKSGELLPRSKEALINSEGSLAQKAENGKYYCGKPVLSCECCDMTCGPSQGCNCSSCQTLQNQAEENSNGIPNIPLMHPPKSWFWSNNLTHTDLEKYLLSLEVNQKNIVHESMNSVQSFDRLDKRIAVLGRHLAALSHQCFGESNKEESKKSKISVDEDDKKKEKYVLLFW